MTDRTHWMLCYDVVVGRHEGKDIRRTGRQAACDSFAAHHGDPVAALMLADDLNELYAPGSHWIEDENGTPLDRAPHAMAIAARRAATQAALADLSDAPGREVASEAEDGPA